MGSPKVTPLAADGPSAAELAAIEVEWPLIAAEMDVVDAEIRLLIAGWPSELDWRRLRRAERAVTRAAVRVAVELLDGRRVA